MLPLIILLYLKQTKFSILQPIHNWLIYLSDLNIPYIIISILYRYILYKPMGIG